MNYIAPYKQLIKDSEAYLILINSKEYLELQVKFNKKYLSLRNELNAMNIVIKELNTNKNTFIKKDIKTQYKTDQEQSRHISKVPKIDNYIKKMDIEIASFNHTIDMRF